MSTLLTQSIDELRANDRQWEAFLTQQNCVVVAPPGSGKTKLLTTRMASDLLNYVAPPQGAACVTFTVAAANELRSRMQRLGVEMRPASFIGTVHSFALKRILLPFARPTGRSHLADLRIATTPEKNAAFQTAAREVLPSFADTTNLKSTVEFARKRFATDEEWDLLGEQVRTLAAAYKKALRAMGLIDFEGVVEEAVDIVQAHPPLQRVLQARFPRIYVDEYQDLSPGLDKLVKLLCFGGDRPSQLFAVGDPDQAIFSFMGTRPELLYQLADAEGVHCVRLERNYRCGEEIIRRASFVKESEQPTKGVRPGGEVKVKHCADGYAQQLNEVATAIKQYRDQEEVPLEEISVICATNAECRQAAGVLHGRNIPAFYRTSEYRAITGPALIEAGAAWCFLGRERSGIRLSSILSLWRSLHRSQEIQSDEVALTSALLSVEPSTAWRATDFTEILLNAGLEQVLADLANDEDRMEVQRMLAAYTAGLEDNQAPRMGQRARREGRVEVTTMNSSKGLEFDRVLIPGMDQGRIPSNYAMRDSDQMPEERRKFYVSLTRARDRVEVFYSGFVEREWGTRRHGPSIFLKELGLVE